MRQADASSSLSQAADVEGELLMKSGGGKIASVYLSSVSEFIKKNSNSNRDLSVDTSSEISYEELMGISASKEMMAEYFYPARHNSYAPPSSLAGCSESPQACRRCGINFTPSKYYNLTDKSTERICRYHEGKIEKIGGLRVYGCCQALVGDANGCETRDWHVFEGFKKGDPVPRYAKLQNANSAVFKAVALDAEMFYTVGGYEVSRVTAVDFFTEATLIDVLVHPRYAPVLDYNTKWSGVSAESYESGQLPVLQFEEMKGRLAGIIGEETIMIGHSLDNDLRVLEVLGFIMICVLYLKTLYNHPCSSIMI